MMWICHVFFYNWVFTVWYGPDLGHSWEMCHFYHLKNTWKWKNSMKHQSENYFSPFVWDILSLEKMQWFVINALFICVKARSKFEETSNLSFWKNQWRRKKLDALGWLIVLCPHFKGTMVSHVLLEQFLAQKLKKETLPLHSRSWDQPRPLTVLRHPHT